MSIEKEKSPASSLALLPFLVFVLFYVGLSLRAGDFYKVPMPISFVVASAAALFDKLADSPSIGPGSTHARLAPRAVGPLLRFLGLFLRYHLPDAPLEGRALALAALAR